MSLGESTTQCSEYQILEKSFQNKDIPAWLYQYHLLEYVSFINHDIYEKQQRAVLQVYAFESRKYK